MSNGESCDVIVIGGGHAGIEAAHASARMGCETLLVTMDASAIGRMSCNPAVGGIGKGHIVREIDALGGIMGRLADATGIQFRLLNRKKGPAVWSPRCQSDKAAYAKAARTLLQATPRLTILEGVVEHLIVRDGRVQGIRLADGRTLSARAVVISSGTFMNGLVHVGLETESAGRYGEPPSTGLPQSLLNLGFAMGRLKTGTPPRIDRTSVCYDELQVQEGDPDPVFFSFATKTPQLPQTVCWVTSTNHEIHEIIRANLDRSPLYCGRIKGIGPRYCPSIEDKVVKFSDKPAHTIFLEPEGLEAPWLYVNGLSTSLPRDVQDRIIHRIPGLQDSVITRYGYAIEYDFVFPHQLKHTLETRNVQGLFLSGQINGTTGYEEAAGQGLIAGINAASLVLNRPQLVLSRQESYIAIMIDDLVTKGIQEPYRMFTSRAEFRLMLRIDNADDRLTEYGYRAGLIDEERYAEVRRKRERKNHALVFLNEHRPTAWIKKDASAHPYPIKGSESLAQLLKRPEVHLDVLLKHYDIPPVSELNFEERRSLELEVKYEGYITRQRTEADKIRRRESVAIPPELPLERIPGLRREIVEKIRNHQPSTLGEALRIQGVTPASILLLNAFIERWQKTGRL